MVGLVCLIAESDAGEGVVGEVFQPVAAAFESVDVGVVDDAVDHGGGDGLVAEDVSPAGEWQVAGQDQRGVFVTAGDELEEQVGGVLLEGQVANFVDDDQCVAAESGEFSSKPVSLVSVLETGHPVGGGGEQHALSGVAGGDAEGDRRR